MTLSLINNVTKTEYRFEVGAVVSALYYDIEVSLDDGMSDGEYTYGLYDGDRLLSYGLCQIGEYKSETKEYNKKSKIIQYGGN